MAIATQLVQRGMRIALSDTVDLGLRTGCETSGLNGWGVSVARRECQVVPDRLIVFSNVVLTPVLDDPG